MTTYPQVQGQNPKQVDNIFFPLFRPVELDTAPRKATPTCLIPYSDPGQYIMIPQVETDFQ